MSHCITSFKGLYLQLGLIGHGGTLKTNFIPLFTAHCDALGSAIGRDALFWDHPHLSCCICHHPGVQLVVMVVVVERLSFSLAQVALPPLWEFEREHVLVPSFSLHFIYSAWHWVSLLVLFTETQQACIFSSVLYTVEGQCTEADRGSIPVSNG